MNAAFQLMVITLFAKVLGLIRELIFAYFLGTSAVKDIYVIAALVPLLLSNFIAGTVTSAFIPRYHAIRRDRGAEEAGAFTANLVNVLFLLSLVIVVLVAVFAEPITGLMARGWSQDQVKEGAVYVQIMVISLIIISVHSPFNGYLNIHDDFRSPALTVAINNIVLIIFCFIAARTGQWLLLAVGFVVAYLLQHLHFIPALRKTGYRHRMLLSVDDNIRGFLKLSLPMLLSVAAADFAQIIDKMIATTLFEIGGASSLDYASKLITMVSGIFIASIITAIYPKLSQLAQKQDRGEFKEEVASSIEMLCYLIVPIIIGMAVLAEPIIQLVFQRGSFTGQDSLVVGGLLRYYSPSLLGEAIFIFITRVFYSINDTRIPIRIMLVQVAVDIPLNFILSSLIGINGLALSSSLGALAAGAFGLYCYKKRFVRIGLQKISLTLVKIATASAIMGLACYFLYGGLPALSLYLRLPLVILAGMLVYFVSTALLGINMMGRLMTSLVRKRRES